MPGRAGIANKNTGEAREQAGQTSLSGLLFPAAHQHRSAEVCLGSLIGPPACVHRPEEPRSLELEWFRTTYREPDASRPTPHRSRRVHRESALHEVVAKAPLCREFIQCEMPLHHHNRRRRFEMLADRPRRRSGGRKHQ